VDDFVFNVGDGTPGGWKPAPAPDYFRASDPAVYNGSAVITWPDGSIKNQWLRVTVLANADTLLPADDVFYYGNLVGETGDRATPFRVSAMDVAGTRDAYTGIDLAPITTRFDHNWDRRVNARDVVLARLNLSHSLRVLTAPAAPPAAGASNTPAPVAAATSPAPGANAATTAATAILRDDVEPPVPSPARGRGLG
jgi:hypothetical protein